MKPTITANGIGYHIPNPQHRTGLRRCYRAARNKGSDPEQARWLVQRFLMLADMPREIILS